MPNYLLLQGNARTLPLADNSVHVCISSPPYWGLRTYGTNPQVWGGRKDCPHAWGEWSENHDLRHRDEERRDHTKSRHTDRSYGDDPTRTFDGQHQKHMAGAYCSLCGAILCELGLEPVLDCERAGGPHECGACFVCHIVEVYREVRRVLHPSGTCWANLGDSYACAPNGRSAAATKDAGNDDRTFRDKPFSTANHRGSRPPSGKHATDTPIPDVQPNRCSQANLKPKDLCGVPWRVALALQRDGWWLRSDCIWSKVNPLPSSVKDRPATSHEYIFLLTKRPNYYYDWVAVRQKATWGVRVHNAVSHDAKYTNGQNAPGHNPHSLYKMKTSGSDPASGRNLRTVWSFSTQPLSAKKFGVDVEHFAAFPERLVEPCIKAGASAHGVCAKCGAPWGRITQPFAEYSAGESFNGKNSDMDPQASHRRLLANVKAARAATGSHDNPFPGPITLGWHPTCRCRQKLGTLPDVEPAVVLDPFCGSGTVGVVALRHGHHFIGVDLSAPYLELARARIEHSLTEKPKKPRKPRPPKPDQFALPL